MVLVIPDGLTKNCVISSGRFGVVGPKTSMEAWVRGQAVSNRKEVILLRRAPFLPE